eukprot:Em0021g42a
MGVEQSQFEARLSCGNLDINGPGQQRFEKLPAALEFMVKMPQSETSENYSTADESYHSCIFEVASMDYTGQPDDNTVACRLTLRGRTYIDRTEVNSKEAQIHVTFKESPNDVFTIDHGCRRGDVLGHDRVVTMQESRFSLQSPGTEQTPMVISVGFYPDCDNDTVRELYTHQRMHDCYLEVYSLCQEGVELIMTTAVQTSDEAMFCLPPKRLHTQVLEHMALSLRIESKPVLALILTSFNTLLLYLLLIPIGGIRCLYIKWKWNRTYQKVSKKDPSSKGSPGLPHGNYVIHSEDESDIIGSESKSNTKTKQDKKTSPISKAVSSPDMAPLPPNVATPPPQNAQPIQDDTHHNATPPLSPVSAVCKSAALLVSTPRDSELGPRPPHGMRAGRLSSMPALATPPRAGPDHYPPAPP